MEHAVRCERFSVFGHWLWFFLSRLVEISELPLLPLLSRLPPPLVGPVGVVGPAAVAAAAAAGELTLVVGAPPGACGLDHDAWK